MKTVLMNLLLWFDVQVNHRLPDWGPYWLQRFLYLRICAPAGLWECRDDEP